MELKDTVDSMLSDIYIDRFKAEYYQTQIRYYKLRKVIENYQEIGVDKSRLPLLKYQAEIMGEYLFILSERAKAEKVEL